MGGIRAVDLFAGAGGASTGLMLAARRLGLACDLTAINHWRAAVDTHERNHPQARHLCERVEAVDPRDIVPTGKLHLLVAGPECTHHSQAAGGRPKNDQSRASGWHILRWCELLQVGHLIIENVPEYRKWGPLNAKGHPIKAREGETYQAFLGALRSMNYRIKERVINAADYGEAQTRSRLFIQAARGRRPILWPEPSHSRAGAASLLRTTERWRGAKEVIDWSLKGLSIFNRPIPLAPATLARIETGLARFGGKAFLLSQASGGAPRSADDPMPTITTDGALQLVEPFTMPYCSNGGQLARPVSQPMGTITTKDRIALVQPAGGDVLFRMLQPHELAAAMGFPSDYEFLGSKSDRVKMIGNAWSVRVAQALCETVLQAWATTTPTRRTRAA